MPLSPQSRLSPDAPLSPKIGSLVFDKDDDLAVEFVTAASNLRSFCYDIPEQVDGSAGGGH